MRILVLLICLSIWLASCGSGDEAGKRPEFTESISVGSPAPDFLYKEMDGKPFRLSEKRGRAVILFFWRLKCADCTHSMESLEELNKKYKNGGLLVAAIGADTMHSAPVAQVREFLDKNGYTFTAIRDSDGFVSEAFSVIKAPTAYIIDKNGAVAAVRTGKTDWMSTENRELIERLLMKD